MPVSKSASQPPSAGIYLAPLEEQSSRMFEFVFRMFATGAAALPAGGIGAVGTQLGGALAELPNCRVELSTPVSAVEQGTVTLADGRTINCEQVVVATEGPVAAKLLEGKTKAPLSGNTNIGFGGGRLVESLVMHAPWLLKRSLTLPWHSPGTSLTAP